MKFHRTSSLRTISLASALLVLVCASPCATAQNLVINGDFNQNVSAWENPEPPAAVWSSTDANTSAKSGSAQLLNSSASASNRHIVLRQCVTSLLGGKYRVEVAGLVPAQNSGGRLVVTRIDHSSADCSGGFNASSGYFIQPGAVWQRTQAESPAVAAAGSSIELLISIEKDAAGGSFIAHVDDVRLVATAMFADGFE